MGGALVPGCETTSEIYYYYYDEGNVTNVFTENLAPVGGEKPFSATALVYAKNNRTVTFAVGEEWTDETDYEALWGREYRYDQARARYLRTVLGPEELENGNFVGTDTWSQYGERSERKRAATGKASRDARVRPATCPEEASTMRVTGGGTRSTPTTL